MAEDDANQEEKQQDEAPAAKKKKPKKPKAKNGKSEMGGTGQYSDKTYEQIVKKDIEYVDALVNSRDPLPNEEEEFVDWILNKPEGRELYKKFNKGGQAKCLAKCTVM